MHSCGNVQAEGLSGEVWTVPPQPRGWAEWVPGECEERRAEGLKRVAWGDGPGPQLLNDAHLCS